MSDPRFADLATEIVRLELAALEFLGGWFPPLIIAATFAAVAGFARLIVVTHRLRR